MNSSGSYRSKLRKQTNFSGILLRASTEVRPTLCTSLKEVYLSFLPWKEKISFTCQLEFADFQAHVLFWITLAERKLYRAAHFLCYSAP